ncbi:unnamed protein product [Rhodiola kirilowii]
MDLREGQNITRPPLLEGNKYGYWRVRMKAFLKSQDESIWEAIENGWTHPVTTEAGKVNVLAKDKWTEIQKSAGRKLQSNECHIIRELMGRISR